MLKQICLVSFLAAAGPVLAADDPSVAQVYDEARSGHVSRAIEMMGQVLQEHPQSAKAHYVLAELYAEQGNFSRAREQLDEARRLSPGLSFANSHSIQALERTLSQPAFLRRTNDAQPGFRIWEAIIGFAAAGGILWMFMRRRPMPNAAFASNVATSPPLASAPLASAPVASSPASPPVPGASANATSASAGSAGSGIGSAIAGGLAAGAGVVAGQEIARHLFGSGSEPVVEVEQPSPQVASHDPGLGGDDFGISDTSSWDDNSGIDDDDGDDDSWS